MKQQLKDFFKSELARMIFPLLLIFVSGVANGVMDTLQFHYSSSVFATWSPEWQSWLDPSKSWVMKWQIGNEGQVILKERFWGSSTWFSFTTDAWHCAKFIYQNSLIAAFAYTITIWVVQAQLKHFIIVFMVIKALQMCGFTLFYDFLL